MEPQVADVLVDYYKGGGNIDQANDLLASGYLGLCPLSNLVGYWLTALEADEAPSTSSKHTKAEQLQSIEYERRFPDCRRLFA